MRIILSLFCVGTLSLSSCKQPDKEYVFRDINMHIRISGNYVQNDSFPKPILRDANGDELTDAGQRKELEDDLMKGLLNVSSTNGENTAWVSLAKQTAKTGDFESYARFSKDMQKFLAVQQMTNYDTISSVLRVNEIQLHKFLTYSTGTTPKNYSGIYIGSVKDYFLVIKVDYTDEEFGMEMEKAILASSFK